MRAEEAIRQVTRRETRGSWLLWFALLAPPSAWAVELIANYSLEEWFACSAATQQRGEILGLSVDAVALGITTALTVLSVLGLLVAIRCYTKLRRSDRGDIAQRARWMALAGIFNGILYTIIIVASFAVPLILDSCRTTP